MHPLVPPWQLHVGTPSLHFARILWTLFGQTDMGNTKSLPGGVPEQRTPSELVSQLHADRQSQPHEEQGPCDEMKGTGAPPGEQRTMSHKQKPSTAQEASDPAGHCAICAKHGQVLTH